MSGSESTARVRVGDRVPPLERCITTAEIMAYGAATWDWHRLHHDQAFARAQGLPDVVLDGQSYGALFSRALVDWLGPRAFVSKLGYRMRSMVFPGDRVSVLGEVTAVREMPGEPAGALLTVAQRLLVGERLAADATTEVRIRLQSR